LSVINDILDFSKIEEGKLELHRAEFDIREVIDEVAGVLAPGAEAKGLSLVSESGCPLPTVVGDRARLRQVLVNLVSNAIKFTSRGRVSIGASLEADLACDVVVRIDVRDTGIGIDPADQEKLFRPFVQADASTTRGYGGSGLGLAICREIVERMGGCLGLESSPGKGSRFWVTVTLPKGSDSYLERGGRPGSRRSTLPLARAVRPARVLLVEDNSINAEVAGHILRTAGHAFDLVSDGAAAVEAALGDPYDVILMDCHLPRMDGYEATRRIRELEAAGRIRGATGRPLFIIALTASATTHDLQRALESGMNLHVSKPVEPARLLSAIEGRLGGAVLGADRPTQPSPRIADPRRPSATSFDRALARLQFDEGLLRKIIGQFVEGAPLAEARLEAAVAARDARAVHFETHRLRGQAASFDAEALVRAIDGVVGAVTDQDWPVADAVLRELRRELERLMADLLAHLGP
jgi:CheY-like chemotaxis protein